MFPFGGIELRVVGLAGDCRCLYWVAILGVQGVVISSWLFLLRVPMLKSPMFVQSLSCVLIEVLRRRLLPLYKVWASSSALGEELVLRAGGLLVGGG
jgi:hypothetical protein